MRELLNKAATVIAWTIITVAIIVSTYVHIAFEILGR